MRFAQGKLRAGSGEPAAEILSAAKDDSQDISQVLSQEALSPNVWAQGSVLLPWAQTFQRRDHLAVSS